jgi:hypothetical protein
MGAIPMVGKIREVERKMEIRLNKKEAALRAASFLFKKSGGKESGLNSFGLRT